MSIDDNIILETDMSAEDWDLINEFISTSDLAPTSIPDNTRNSTVEPIIEPNIGDIGHSIDSNHTHFMNVNSIPGVIIGQIFTDEMNTMPNPSIDTEESIKENEGEIEVEEIKKIFNNIFDEENLSFDSKAKGFLNVIVKYPELLIKSSYGESHTIRDLYVRYKFAIYKLSDYWGISLSDLDGIRGKCSLDEYLANYNHSHLSSSILERGVFCFGSGEIAGLRSSLANGFFSISEKDTFGYLDTLYAFLLSMEEFLKIESSNTNPYKYISSVGTSNIYSSRQSTIISDNVYRIGTVLWFKILNSKELRTYFINECLIITDKEVLVNAYKVMRFINSIVDFNKSGLLPSKFNPITFEIMKGSINMQEHFTKEGFSTRRGSTGFLFKGKNIKLQLTDNIEVEEGYETVSPEIIYSLIHNIFSFIKDLKYEPRKFKRDY